MKLKDYSKEEIEAMGYDDIAELVLRETGKKMKTIDLYKKVNSLLDNGEADNMDKIGDFFELLSTNKKFALISGQWDLKSKHNSKVIIEDDDDEIIESAEDMPELKEEDENEDIFYESDDNDDDDDDDLKDLLIIDEDEDDAGIM